MTSFADWVDIRAELSEGDEAGLPEERARTEAWIRAYEEEESPVGGPSSLSGGGGFHQGSDLA